MNNEEILLEIKLSYADALKGMAELTVANENLSKQIKEQKALFKSLKDVTDDEKRAKSDTAKPICKVVGKSVPLQRFLCDKFNLVE